jgi:hypothetical protein
VDESKANAVGISRARARISLHRRQERVSDSPETGSQNRGYCDLRDAVAEALRRQIIS